MKKEHYAALNFEKEFLTLSGHQFKIIAFITADLFNLFFGTLPPSTQKHFTDYIENRLEILSKGGLSMRAEKDIQEGYELLLKKLTNFMDKAKND